MKYLRLIAMMTRYRAALVLIIFLLLGIFLQPSGLQYISAWKVCVAAIVLVLTYIYAACVNDIADYKLDVINVKHHVDRPLVNGQYSHRDVMILAVAAAIVALGVSLIFFSWWATLIIALALLINSVYSLPPLKISYRAWLTPFFLPLAYVVVPFLLSLALSGFRYFPLDYLAAFYFLFVARISLKDIRDRAGDAANGKPTLILRYGKTAVCMLSVVALVIGTGLLIYAVRDNVFFQAAITVLLVCVLAVEYRLWRATVLADELQAIAQIARLGNAVLLGLLGSLLLDIQAAPIDVYAVFYFLIIGIYGYMTWMFLQPRNDDNGKK